MEQMDSRDRPVGGTERHSGRGGQMDSWHRQVGGSMYIQDGQLGRGLQRNRCAIDQALSVR